MCGHGPPIHMTETIEPDVSSTDVSVAETDEAPSCLNCGAAVQSAYCPDCGQHFQKSQRLSLRELLYDAVRVLHYDGPLFRSLNSLVRRPGFLTREYVAGRRATHVNPGRLFFLVMVASFFVANILDTTTIQEWIGEEQFVEVAERSGLPPEAVEARLSTRFDTAYRLSIFLIIPLVTALFWLLHVRSRRPFLLHAVYALHLISFFLVLVLVIEVVDIVWEPLGYAAMAASLLVALPWYIYRSLREAYDQSRWAAVAKGAVGSFWFIMIIAAYFVAIEAAVLKSF